ncbi:hypothetical protein M9458_050650 [Cirrhinus mrigala]|uniref:Reverse transcriptase n=1 Tax=Cirrhinus mrigala TaxID=683832 RepID=A0ABD0MY66_CIRMR
MQFGRVDEYKEPKEDFESYIERFEQWLLANDIASKKKVEPQYERKNVTLPLVIVKGERPALLGQNWLEKIHLDWPNIFNVEKAEVASDPAVKAVLRRHTEVFSDKPSAIKDFKATIRVRPDATPIFQKARPVPYALREAVEKELDRLEKAGIVSKIDRSDWAAPIVVVPKSDKSIRRICSLS